MINVNELPVKNPGKNKGGRPLGSQNKDKPFRAALVRLLQLADGNPARLDEIAAVLIAQASTGEIQAIREIADRLDGRPAQAVEIDDVNAYRTPEQIYARIAQILAIGIAIRTSGINGENRPWAEGHETLSIVSANGASET